MFYLHTVQFQKKNLPIDKFHVPYSWQKKSSTNNLYVYLYNTIPANTINSIFIFRKLNERDVLIPLPLATRFAKISTISLKKSKIVLNKIISDLIYNFSFNTLYYFFKKLFWVVPVPKHKQLLYLIRAIFKYAFNLTTTWTGLSVTLRGKLAATGNKRTTTFKCLLGNGSASNVLSSTQTDFRNITTTTGLIGVTSIITYIR